MSQTLFLTDLNLEVEAGAHTDTDDRFWANIRLFPVDANGDYVIGTRTELYLSEKTVRDLFEVLGQSIDAFDRARGVVVEDEVLDLV